MALERAWLERGDAVVCDRLSHRLLKGPKLIHLKLLPFTHSVKFQTMFRSRPAHLLPSLTCTVQVGGAALTVELHLIPR